MAGFLVAAAALCSIAVLIVVRALRTRSHGTAAVSWSATNAALHAAELAAVERDAPGDLAARDEIYRRALEEGIAAPAARILPTSRGVVFAAASAVPLIACALYLLVGNPVALRAPDAMTEGGAALPTVEALDAHLRHEPRDGRAWVVLARLHMQADRFQPAAQAYEQALAVAPKISGDPDVWCELADALGMVQGGSLRGKPTAFIDRALSLRPGHPRALEMAGSAAIEAGDYAAAQRHWSALLAQLRAGSPEHAQLQTALGRVEERIAVGRP